MSCLARWLDSLLCERYGYLPPEGLVDRRSEDIVREHVRIQLYDPPYPEVYITAVLHQSWKSFAVPEDLICGYSKYFAGIFQENCKRKTNTNRRIVLPNTSPYLFEMFLHWMHTGQLRTIEEDDTIKMWIDVCLMAEKYSVVGLRNDALRKMNRLPGRGILSHGNLVKVWRRSKKGSPLRKYWVERLGLGGFEFLG